MTCRSHWLILHNIRFSLKIRKKFSLTDSLLKFECLNQNQKSKPKYIYVFVYIKKVKNLTSSKIFFAAPLLVRVN